MQITIYVEDWEDKEDVEESVKEAIKSHFLTSKSDAKQVLGDDISKCRLSIKIGELKEA